ncbi:MAG TPA: PAS domain-containing protein [Candidatus Deferrimicrobiaceae bacterium]|jgi:PAS domain S-box-containing protein
MVPGPVPHLIETFLSGIPAFLFSLKRTDLSLLWITGASAEMTGFDPRDLAARPDLFADRFSPVDRERISRICAVAGAGHTAPEDFRFRCADGKTRWVRIVFIPSAGLPGDPLSIAGMAWSIEEARNLRRETHLGQEALLAADAPIILTDLSGKIRLWNAAAERFFGCGSDRMVGSAIHSLFSIPPGAVEGLIRRVREEGAVTREDRLTCRGGEPIHCRLTISLLRDEEGAPEGTVVSVGGMAELRGLEARLQEAVTRLRIIEKVNRIIASEWDFRKVQTLIVEELEKLIRFDRISVALLGDEKDAAIIQVSSKGPTELGSGSRVPLDRSSPGWVVTRRIARIDEDMTASGEEFTENRVLIREGMRSRLMIPLFAGEQIVGTLNFNSRATGAYSLATIEDLGSIPDQLALAIQKHRAYVRLKRSEQRYRLLFEQGPPAAISGPDGRFVDVNDGCLRLTGYSREDFLRLRNTDLYDDPEQATPSSDVLSSGRAFEKEAIIRRRDGSRFFGHINIFPVSKDLVLGQITDVTERKELEGRLRQAQKMEAVGNLAGGIAHDFNNIIQTIIGYTSLLKTRLEGQPKTASQVDAIEQASLRAAELTRQLLGFARQGKFEVTPTDLGAVVEKVVSMIRPTFDRSIDIRTELSSGLFSVSGDAGQMEHTLLNLCINARDAMPGGGTLRIETRNETLVRPEAFGTANAPAGRYVSLSVSDTGTGIPPENLPRIFDPFFTTKEPGKGSGMGLAMVYGIVKNHGGWIDVHSAVGEGTTFRVLLPASAARPKAPAAAPLPESPLGGSETILFVDDEESLRELAVETLGSLGYSVVTARNGADAVALYAERRGEIALVILDLIMPEMGGVEAFHRIREIDPGARILFSSGYAASGQPDALPAEGADGFIQKPYRLSALAAAIRQALGGRS